MKSFFTRFLLVVLAGSFLSVPVYAQNSLTNDINRQLDAGGAKTGLTQSDPRDTVAFTIRIFLGILGIIAVVLMLYAGFQWMTAGGNSEQIGTAKSIMINATIGLAIILSAYAITYAVFEILLDGTWG